MKLNLDVNIESVLTQVQPEQMAMVAEMIIPKIKETEVIRLTKKCMKHLSIHAKNNILDEFYARKIGFDPDNVKDLISELYDEINI